MLRSIFSFGLYSIEDLAVSFCREILPSKLLGSPGGHDRNVELKLSKSNVSIMTTLEGSESRCIKRLLSESLSDVPVLLPYCVPLALDIAGSKTGDSCRSLGLLIT